MERGQPRDSLARCRFSAGRFAGSGAAAAFRSARRAPVKRFNGPVGVAHVFHPHGTAGARGVDEAAFSHIDAHMAEGAAHGVEEHQVAGLELVLLDRFEVLGPGLLVGPARQHQPHAHLKDVAREAAAVKAVLDGGAARV